VTAAPIRIGTRGSALALWQARHVRDRLQALGHAVELRTIVTTGDRVLDRRLEAVGGKGAFLKEIEEALLAGEVDLAVHSLKDVPTTLPAGLELCAFLERADPRDAWLSADRRALPAMPQGARVGTTSLRRIALLRDLRPDLVLQDLRGNVDTRIRRLRERAFDAIVLAMAGLARLGRQADVTHPLDAETFVPAPGQGVVALECREGDERVRGAVAPLHHAATAAAAAAERAVLSVLGGGCNVPMGAHARADGGGLRLVAFVERARGGGLVRATASGADPFALGRAVGEDLRRRAAAEPAAR
jgi:hydroxymethylbilane synthase